MLNQIVLYAIGIRLGVCLLPVMVHLITGIAGEVRYSAQAR